MLGVLFINMKKTNQAEKLGVRGDITAKCYDQTTLNFFQTKWNKVVEFLNLSKQRFYILGQLKWADEKKNVVCTAGINALIRRLHGSTTYTGEINKMALGTGASPSPVEGDTTLDTEDYRNDTASGTSSGKIVYVTAFYTETEVDGTFTEFGNFIDGSAGADTGELWTHVAVSWVKANTETLVVDCKYTFNNA